MRALMIGQDQALVDRMASLARAAGLDVVGTTSDDEAASQLESGAVAALVIGAGVEEPVRERVYAAARAHGVAVIPGWLADRDPQEYAHEELLPQLQQVLHAAGEH